jgi:hypothetical protein
MWINHTTVPLKNGSQRTFKYVIKIICGSKYPKYTPIGFLIPKMENQSKRLNTNRKLTSEKSLCHLSKNKKLSFIVTGID